MDKSKPAKFCTDSTGTIAYLLWNSIYPSKFTDFDPVGVLYYEDKDYNKVMLKYWKGVSIPVCEFNECLLVADRILRRKEINYDWFIDMWDEIYDIRSDYRVCLELNVV